jgi:hypothetical protein
MRTTAGLAIALLSLGTFSVAVQAAGAESRKPISVSVSRAPVAKLLRELGRVAEVPLAAGDPVLGGRPLQLFVRGQPLDAVMQELAAFLATSPGTCSWTEATVDRRAGYRLIENSRSRRERAAMLGRLRDERRRRLEVELGTALTMAGLGQNDRIALYRKRPELLAWVTAEGSSPRLLSTLSPTQRALLLSGKQLTLPYPEMSPQQQQIVYRMVGGERRMRHTTPRPGGGSPIVMEWQSPRDLPKTALNFRMAGLPDQPGIRVALPVLPGSVCQDPDALHPALPSDEDVPPWMRTILEQQRDRKRRERLAEAEKDPDLRQKVTLKALRAAADERNPKQTVQKYSDLSACLEQLADETGLCVLGDYDPCWDDYYSWSDIHRPGTRTKAHLMQDVKERPLWEVLGLIEDRFVVSLHKAGKFIRVRSPRVPYAEIDGIDLLDNRPPAPPRIPELEEAERQEAERKR